jgi:hypothetical protein
VAVRSNKNDALSTTYTLTGIASAAAWTLVSVVVLSYHPDPKFVNCTPKHNILTMSQALLFPLSILWATITFLSKAASDDSLSSSTARRLNLGLCLSSTWLAASAAYPPTFCFGYQLIPRRLQVAAIATHLFTSLLALRVWAKTTKAKSMGAALSRLLRGGIGSLWNLPPKEKTPMDHLEEDGKSSLASLYALGTVGLLCFTLLPVISPYPLATIPSVLGKRLSRPAAAFYFLAAVQGYSLKDAADNKYTFPLLAKGFLWGSGGHLLLLILKLVGIDDGGWLLPGWGLWNWYPAMLRVPFALGTSLAMHALMVWASALALT